MNRKCSKCQAPMDRQRGYCADCHATYMRQWRKDRVYVSRETILRLVEKKKEATA